MIHPAQAALRLAMSVALGMALGLVYAFLRPLRRRHLADLVFLLAGFWIWLFLSFGICQGDLRPGYWAGMAGGFFLFRATLARFFTGIFAGFWKIILWPWRVLKKFLRKSRLFLKNLFASGKKSGTIIELKKSTHKGARHGTRKKLSEPDPAGLQAQQ